MTRREELGGIPVLTTGDDIDSLLLRSHNDWTDKEWLDLIALARLGLDAEADRKDAARYRWLKTAERAVTEPANETHNRAV
jgi:hypothetical protein